MKPRDVPEALLRWKPGPDGGCAADSQIMVVLGEAEAPLLEVLRQSLIPASYELDVGRVNKHPLNGHWMIAPVKSSRRLVIGAIRRKGEVIECTLHRVQSQLVAQQPEGTELITGICFRNGLPVAIDPDIEAVSKCTLLLLNPAGNELLHAVPVGKSGRLRLESRLDVPPASSAAQS